MANVEARSEQRTPVRQVTKTEAVAMAAVVALGLGVKSSLDTSSNDTQPVAVAHEHSPLPQRKVSEKDFVISERDSHKLVAENLRERKAEMSTWIRMDAALRTSAQQTAEAKAAKQVEAEKKLAPMKLLKAAEEEFEATKISETVAYEEKDKENDYTKYGYWYEKNVAKEDGYANAPWCNMFLTWIANKEGVEQYTGEDSSTVSQSEWFQHRGAWGQTPKPGAYVFFDFDGGGIDHVGLVVKSGTKGEIHTIEGNTNEDKKGPDALEKRIRDTGQVAGYGYPDKTQVTVKVKVASPQTVR